MNLFSVRCLWQGVSLLAKMVYVRHDSLLSDLFYVRLLVFLGVKIKSGYKTLTAHFDLMR